MLCFTSDVGRYKKIVEGIQQWVDVGESGETENKACNCILDQWQGSDGTNGKPCQDSEMTRDWITINSKSCPVSCKCFKKTQTTVTNILPLLTLQARQS